MSDYSMMGFLCDSVRVEADNRSSLIGICSSLIRAPHAFLMPAGVFVRIQPPPPQGSDVSIRITLDDQQLFEVGLEAPPLDQDDERVDPAVHITLDRLILDIQHGGTMRLSAKLNHGDYHPLMAIKIKIDDTHSS